MNVVKNPIINEEFYMDSNPAYFAAENELNQ